MPPKTPLDIWNDALALAGKVMTGTATEEDVNSFREKYQTPQTEAPVESQQTQYQQAAPEQQKTEQVETKQDREKIPALQSTVEKQVSDSEKKESDNDNGGFNLSETKLPASIVSSTSATPAPENVQKVNQEKNRDLNPSVETKNGQTIDDLRKNFDQEQSDMLERLKGVEKLYTPLQYGQEGFDPNNHLYQQQMADIDNYTSLNQVSSTAKDAMRRVADENGNIKTNPFEWNLLGVNSQTKTPEAARGIYENLFKNDTTDGNSNPMSSWRKTEVNPITSHDAQSNIIRQAYIDAGMNPDDNSMYQLNVDQINNTRENTMVDPNLIDDGQSVASRESAFMTGEQYLKYLGAGIPGRDANQINPDKIYSKQDEMENYGFVPYITSDESLDRFHEVTAPHSAANYFNDLADFRRDITDHKLNVDGEEFSGKDFDKNFSLWNQKLKSNPNGHKLIDRDPGEFDIPQTPVMYDTQGNRYVAPNEPIDYQQREDGSIIVKFNNNPDDDWVFDDQEDYNKSLRYEPAKDGEFVIGWETGWDPLVLDSGQKIRADKALDINKNYSQYVDYGPGNISKPNPEGVLENPSDVLPWFVDMALSSAPYFDTRTAATKGVADTFASAQGMKPGRQGSDGTYNLVSENPNFNEVASSTIGSAILPVTEHLWGPLGEHMFNGPTRAVLSHIPGIKNLNLESIPGRWFTGTSDEGVEEIAGNIVEELINSGQSGWYANDVMKQNPEGKWVVDYDEQGRAKKEDTNFIDRLRNFVFDAPEAYVGGAALGGILGSARIPEYMQENAKKKKEIEEVGYNRKNTNIDYDKLSETSALSEMERRRYDRGRQ